MTAERPVLNSELRIESSIPAGRPGKTIHYLSDDGTIACGLAEESTKRLHNNSLRPSDRPCPDCLGELQVDRDPSDTITDRFGRISLRWCPDCRRDLRGCTTQAHISSHDPEDFGLSPVRDVPEPGPAVATDGGEPHVE